MVIRSDDVVTDLSRENEGTIQEEAGRAIKGVSENETEIAP